MSNKKYRIAIDAMGSDFAPENEVRGAELLGSEKTAQNAELIFVGKQELIEKTILGKSIKLPYEIVNADEVITMEDKATSAIKEKRNSSLFIGNELVNEGRADAIISAGNTGAMMSAATIILGRIRGVSRPTIGSFFPTVASYPTLLLDVGVTVDSRPRFLYEYAVMGNIYYKNVLGEPNPRIGLLNVGEESSKGTEDYKEANKLLSESSLNFIGNVQGSDIFMANAHIIVCDGFTGNVILKFAESFLGFMKRKFKNFADKNIINKFKVALTVPALTAIATELDYQQYGGVPLLGVNGTVIIGHGKSSPLAIKNMLLRAIEAVESGVNKKIETALN